MHKDIADPVHGLIRLNQVEAELLATRAMQRLHNVHQLGLAHLVFPGANYTRHAHSIGACHNSGRMLDAIARNSNSESLKRHEDDFDKYRIIALLHDVGHYPFSHATEHVIDDYFTSLAGGGGLFAAEISNGKLEAEPAPTKKQYHDHEEMGAFIIENDVEITGVLKKYGFDPQEISERFRISKPEYSPISGVISSDLDCDRLDYLRRTAMNSGAPYGSVDINFLIDQAVVDCDGNFGFKSKAARSADHLLVSRFYDYMQVPFNKTAVALEWSLVESLKLIFKEKLIDPSSTAMEARVSSGDDWHTFDDQFLIGKFRDISLSLKLGDVHRDHLNAISRRKPAKMLASWDTLRPKEHTSDDSGNQLYKEHTVKRKELESVVHDFCKSNGLDRERFYVWQTKVKFMKDGSDEQVDNGDPAYFADGVHILDEKDNRGKRLFRRPDMLVHKLNQNYLSGLRAYYLPKIGETEREVSLICSTFISFAQGRFDLPTLP